jgi:hypothetical protein
VSRIVKGRGEKREVKEVRGTVVATLQASAIRQKVTVNYSRFQHHFLSLLHIFFGVSQGIP